MTNQNRKPRAIAIAITRDEAELRSRIRYLSITCLFATVATAILAATVLV
ncbi:hypothetical protein ACSV9I_05265 [Rhizobium sp. G187]|nr:hypothetical protein [Rhizobium sp. AAP43]